MPKKKVQFGKAFPDSVTRQHRSLFERFQKREETPWQDMLLGVSSDFVDRISFSAIRGHLIRIFLLLILVVILGRLFYVQVLNGNSFLAQSYFNSMRLEVIHSQRGVLYDRNHIVIAKSLPSYRVAVDPQKLKSDASQLQTLATILKIDKRKIEEKLNQPLVQVTIGNVADEVALQLKLSENKLPAVSVEVSPIRDYPFGEALSHLLGYTGEVSLDDIKQSNGFFTSGDIKGKLGVELALDGRLRGQAGKELIKVGAQGEKTPFTSKINPIDGESINLTIDSKLQVRLFGVLKDAVEKAKSKGGAAVALNPKTGEVLAAVSYPSYDNNLFAKGITQKEYNDLMTNDRKPMLNRGLSGEYPPASTFKIITATAALEEKIIDKDKELDAPAYIEIGGLKFRDWKTHGKVNVFRALAQSSDTYFYQVGGGYGEQKGLGPDKLIAWSRKFGLGSPTGINLAGEAHGFIPTPEWKRQTFNEPWFTGNTFNMSIGQGDLLTTPFQIANFTSVIANGGTLYRPYYVKGETPLRLRANILSHDTLAIIREGMKQAVEPGGTAWPLRDFRIKSAAKTGTAEALGDPHAIMTAFAPLDNPEIVITALVENGGQGSDVAGPIVRAGFEEWFAGR